MAATASAPPPLSPSAAGGVDQEGSNVSSPLSDVDDKDSNDADMEQLHLDGDDGEDSSLSAAEDGRQVNRDGSDSDSVLSEANSDINSDMNDTEAETERLYDTPETQRQRDVLLDRYNDGQVFEHTPSRLRMTKTMNDDDNGGNDESGSSDNASVAPGRANRIKTLGQLSSTKHTGVDEETQGESQERKRKRSAVADQSDSDQPLRKRTGSVGAPGGVADDDAVMNEEDITPHPDHLDNRSGDEDADSSTRKQRELAEDGATLRETRMSKKVTLSGSKHKGAAADDVDEEADREAHDETRDATIEEDVEQADEEVEAEADAEEEADTAAKNLEECTRIGTVNHSVCHANHAAVERKQAALKDWTHIEEMFGVFRDRSVSSVLNCLTALSNRICRLYKDRLQRLEEEEQSLLADVPTHPEYLNMKQCIDDRLNKKLEEIDTEYEFRIKAHERRAVAQRAQIWSQYFQAVRERREKALELLNKEWYEVQAARRSAHSLPDYGLLFPKEPTFRLRNAIAFNSEVSTLAGVAKYEGFPAAPNMTGASIAEVQDDLNAIEVS